jgi:hypothetical protein
MSSKYFKTGFQFLKSGLGGTKKADQIKKANQTLKSLEQTMATNKLSPELRERGDKLKKEVKQTQKEIYKAPSTKGFKKGGRIGFRKGTGRTGVPAMDIKTKISLAKKKKKNQGDLGMQSVKYGIDRNPNITAADPKAKFIAANKKNKKKVV